MRSGLGVCFDGAGDHGNRGRGEHRAEEATTIEVADGVLEGEDAAIRFELVGRDLFVGREEGLE